MSNLSLDEMTIDSKLAMNPETFPAPCPACGTGVRYNFAHQVVNCPACGWYEPLTADEAGEYLMAITGCRPLDLGAFLAAIGERPVMRPAQRLATGKLVIPAAKDETPWQQLMRLGGQAALNGSRVLAVAPDGRYVTVSSQEPGNPASYVVTLTGLATCTCKYGKQHPGSACGHIGRAYLHLSGLPPAKAPVVAPPASLVSVQARAAAALDDLFGAA